MATRVRAKSRAKQQVPPGYRRWDAPNCLKSQQGMVAYLGAAMEEARDDPAYIAAVLDDIARAVLAWNAFGEKRGYFADEHSTL